jgi:hypothetical protein
MEVQNSFKSIVSTWIFVHSEWIMIFEAPMLQLYEHSVRTSYHIT